MTTYFAREMASRNRLQVHLKQTTHTFLAGEISLEIGGRIETVIDALGAVSVNKGLIKSALRCW